MDTVIFQNKWVDGESFESTLIKKPDLLTSPVMSVRFEFPAECKIMVSAGVKILSLVNQLRSIGKQVTLAFIPDSATFGYLDRMGFFGLLHNDIQVEPEKPQHSAVDLYRGTSKNLVEFAPIDPSNKDKELPRRLEQALTNAANDHIDKEALGNAAFTMFGESVSNVYEHSETNLNGYAVLQVYKQGGKATVAVSDSGRGLIQTLRPGIVKNAPKFINWTDEALLIEALRNGLSRHGEYYGGDGLKQCAAKAIRYNAQLEVRLPNCYMRFVPSTDGYTASHKAYTHGQMPLLWGTHITFDFSLDLPPKF